MDRKKILDALDDKELSVLFDRLIALRNTLNDGMDAQFNRAMPFAELLLDRWERARQLGFGEGTSIYDSSCIFGKIKVGKNTWIGPYSVLDGSGGLEIGDNCSVGANVQIYTHDSAAWAVSGGKDPYVYASTKIGNNVFIAPNVLITKGVEIGDGCMLGANSFVNRSFPAGTKIAGSPAKKIN